MNRLMTAIVKAECGYEQALEGLSYNKNQDNKNQDNKNMSKVAEKLASRDGGHNKFLESIYIWISVNAARYFWVEADTYRLSTKQSQSTMHTILKRPLEQKDFCRDIDKFVLHHVNDLIKNKEFVQLKTILPEGMLQKRMWCMSYKTLRNIAIQRNAHRLIEWPMFLTQVYAQIEHPELLPPITFAQERVENENE